MATEQPNQYQNQLATYGLGLESSGLTVMGAVDGMGLASMGFLWTLGAYWLDFDTSPTSTSWSASEGAITTNWSSEAAVSTTWTPVDNGIWGEDAESP